MLPEILKARHNGAEEIEPKIWVVARFGTFSLFNIYFVYFMVECANLLKIRPLFHWYLHCQRRKYLPLNCQTSMKEKKPFYLHNS